jgi:hypothetical protein
MEDLYSDWSLVLQILREALERESRKSARTS